MDKSLQLSIIIVNWNVKELLRACLLSLQSKLCLPSDSYEIIVVDNASSDDSLTMLKKDFAHISLIANMENIGFGSACNRGYEISSGKFILLLNPDTLLKDNAIDGALNILKTSPDVGILGCKLVNEDNSFQRASGGAFPTLLNLSWNYLFIRYLIPLNTPSLSLFLKNDIQGTFDIDWVSGAAMMIRREAIENMIFDEDFFMFGEDMDVCYRTQQQGWKVRYTSKHAIVHFHGKSFERQSSLEILATAHKGPRKFFSRQHGTISLFTYDLILLVGYLIRWPLYHLLSAIRPHHGYGALSSFSRQYVGTILRLLFKKTPPTNLP